MTKANWRQLTGAVALTAAFAQPAAAQEPIKLGELNSYKVFASFLEPYRKGWQLAATSDPFEVLSTWPPCNCNVGIATWHDCIVIDVDPDRGGMESLAKLNLPPTLTIKTARGGFHYYFKAPPGMMITNSVNRLGQGIDVRGYGGYVVGPGSIVNASAYRIEREASIT